MIGRCRTLLTKNLKKNYCSIYIFNIYFPAVQFLFTRQNPKSCRFKAHHVFDLQPFVIFYTVYTCLPIQKFFLNENNNITQVLHRHMIDINIVLRLDLRIKMNTDNTVQLDNNLRNKINFNQSPHTGTIKIIYKYVQVLIKNA